VLRNSGKVVVFDTRIPIQLAFYALVEHGEWIPNLTLRSLSTAIYVIKSFSVVYKVWHCSLILPVCLFCVMWHIYPISSRAVLWLT
jgi:hypothetical protein